MSDYIKYRFCPNKTCDNHINKKKFKNGATVCGECGFELKDYDFDPVTRTILNYDDETEEVIQTQESTVAEEPKSEDTIDFSNIPEPTTSLFDANSSEVQFSGGTVVEHNSFKADSAEKPVEKVVQNEQPIVSEPKADASVKSENEALRQQLAEMQKQMALLQSQILNNSKAEEKQETASEPEPQNNPQSFSSVPKEPQTEEKHVSMPAMTEEEMEIKRKKAREAVTEEFLKEKQLDEMEVERERFEREYNQKKKEEEKLIEEERALQRKALEQGKDPSEIEREESVGKGFNTNHDGYYDSNEPTYEEAVKKSIKATVRKVLILAGIIVALLYGILYFTQ